MRYRRLCFSVTMLLALVASMITAPGIVAAVPATQARPVPAVGDLGSIAESVEYLVGAYQVSEAEAVRRLRLGADSAGLVRRLADALPGEYAGAWLDQQHGGHLVVAATDAGRAEQVVRGLAHRDEIRVSTVRYSLQDLDKIRDQIQRRIGNTVFAQTEVTRNRVEVWTDQPDQVTRALAGIITADQAVAVLRSPQVTPTACRPPDFCDPPMRGGITVGMANKKGEAFDWCTSGFNLQDNVGRFYATTAGHCFTPERARYVSQPNSTASNPQLIAIGKNPDGSLADRAYIVDERNPRVDVAIMPILDPATWMPAGKPRNGVYYKCVNPPEPNPPPAACTGPERHRFPIRSMTNYADMIIGEIVCMSGATPILNTATPGTRCGEITDKPFGAIQTNICAKKGDSGSPLFNQVTHDAYGMESGVRPDSGTRPRGRCAQLNDPNDPQETLYTPLSVILTRARQHTGIFYTLITTRDG